MSSIVSRRPSCMNQSKDAFWMSMRLGRSRTCFRREKLLRARGATATLLKCDCLPLTACWLLAGCYCVQGWTNDLGGTAKDSARAQPTATAWRPVELRGKSVAGADSPPVHRAVEAELRLKRSGDAHRNGGAHAADGRLQGFLREQDPHSGILLLRTT